MIQLQNIRLGEPKKALDFGFLALESFQDEEEITLEYVNTNYYLGEVYYFLIEKFNEHNLLND